jgi:hypothetical protein
MEAQDQKSRLSNFEVEEKAAAAEGLLNSPVFKSAIDDIYSRALGTLISGDVGSLTAGQAHAMLKAITELKAQLEQYIADHKVRQKYNKGDK